MKAIGNLLSVHPQASAEEQHAAVKIIIKNLTDPKNRDHKSHFNIKLKKELEQEKWTEIPRTINEFMTRLVTCINEFTKTQAKAMEWGIVEINKDTKKRDRDNGKEQDQNKRPRVHSANTGEKGNASKKPRQTKDCKKCGGNTHDTTECQNGKHPDSSKNGKDWKETEKGKTYLKLAADTHYCIYGRKLEDGILVSYKPDYDRPTGKGNDKNLEEIKTSFVSPW
jgi:hypothetical protein